jgi:hypothetical protein
MGEASPRIEHVEWGRIEVEGLGEGRDFKLFPGGGREWNWTETGTHHRPGIQPSDVAELVQAGCRVVVLSRGFDLELQTCPETVELLEAAGIVVHIAQTQEAVDLYNDLVAHAQLVGGLFHSTC